MHCSLEKKSRIKRVTVSYPVFLSSDWTKQATALQKPTPLASQEVPGTPTLHFTGRTKAAFPFAVCKRNE